MKGSGRRASVAITAVVVWLIALVLLALTLAFCAAWVEGREWWSDNSCSGCGVRTLVTGVLTLLVSAVGIRLLLMRRAARRTDGVREHTAVPRTLLFFGAIMVIVGLVMPLQHRSESRGTDLVLGIPHAQTASLRIAVTLDTIAEEAALRNAPSWPHPHLGDTYVNTRSAFRLDGKNGRGPLRLTLTAPDGSTSQAERLRAGATIDLAFATMERGAYVLTLAAPRGSPGLQAHLDSHQRRTVWAIQEEPWVVVGMATLWVLAGAAAAAAGVLARRREEPARERWQVIGGSAMMVAGISVPVALFFNGYHNIYWGFPLGYPLLGTLSLLLLFTGPLVVTTPFGRRGGRSLPVLFGMMATALGSALATIAIGVGVGPRNEPGYAGLTIHVRGMQLVAPLLMAGGCLLGIGLPHPRDRSVPVGLGRHLIAAALSLIAGVTAGVAAFWVVVSLEDDPDAVVGQLPAAIGTGSAALVITAVVVEILLIRRWSGHPQEGKSRSDLAPSLSQ